MGFQYLPASSKLSVCPQFGSGRRTEQGKPLLLIPHDAAGGERSSPWCRQLGPQGHLLASGQTAILSLRRIIRSIQISGTAGHVGLGSAKPKLSGLCCCPLLKQAPREAGHPMQEAGPMGQGRGFRGPAALLSAHLLPAEGVPLGSRERRGFPSLTVLWLRACG